MCIAKDEKNKCITNILLQSISNGFYDFIQACVTNCVPLFDLVVSIEVSWVW